MKNLNYEKDLKEVIHYLSGIYKQLRTVQTPLFFFRHRESGLNTTLDYTDSSLQIYIQQETPIHSKAIFIIHLLNLQPMTLAKRTDNE